jgi:hypothetical protein
MVDKMNMSVLHQHLNAFKQSDEAREALVHNLVDELQKLHSDYQKKKDDYDNEVESRRLWQEKAREVDYWKGEVQRIKQELDNDPFALALIDGDGVVFQDALIKAAGEGGSEAGHLLQQEIKKYLVEQDFQGASRWPVVVQIFANLDGLTKALVAGGVIDRVSDFHAFVKAFSNNQALFSFVDVGVGKEKADHKIKETFRLFIANHQCKQIFLAGCHDGGYVTTLESYKRDERAISRITLLESTPAAPAYHSLNFKITRFPSVFRTEELQTRPLAVKPNGMAPPTRTVSASPVQSSLSAQAASWAGISSGAPGSPNVISIAPSATPKPKVRTILLNADSLRIDPPNPAISHKTKVDFNERIKNEGKMCNNHYIHGECSDPSCTYVHKARLSAVEVEALKGRARTGHCQYLGGCRNHWCVLSHHCPNGKKCTKGANCHWYDDYGNLGHDVDTTPTYKLYEDGTLEPLKERKHSL